MESAPSSTTTVDGDGDTPTPAAGAAPFSLKGGGFDSRPGPAFHEEGPLFRDTTSWAAHSHRNTRGIFDVGLQTAEHGFTVESCERAGLPRLRPIMVPNRRRRPAVRSQGGGAVSTQPPHADLAPTLEAPQRPAGFLRARQSLPGSAFCGAGSSHCYAARVGAEVWRGAGAGFHRRYGLLKHRRRLLALTGSPSRTYADGCG